MSAVSRKVSDADILQVFRSEDSPVMTAVEIADRVDMTRQGVNRRLKELRENGRVRKKKVGSRAVVWWIPEREY